jgi:hypothetical protein
LLCRDLNLFGRDLIAVDGTRIKAVNSKTRNFTKSSLEKIIKAADERLDDYLNRLDRSDISEAKGEKGATRDLAEKVQLLQQKRAQYQTLLSELEQSGESQVSLTDPDSRAMAAYTKVGVGYNTNPLKD